MRGWCVWKYHCCCQHETDGMDLAVDSVTVSLDPFPIPSLMFLGVDQCVYVCVCVCVCVCGVCACVCVRA